MKSNESAENYLETILVLSQTHPYVRSIDIANEMGFSKPSVSRAMGLLKTGGYILMDKDGLITLTESGEHLASQVYERHRVLTSFFTKLGVDPFLAAQDACRMEHVISAESFEKLKAHLGDMEAADGDAQPQE